MLYTFVLFCEVPHMAVPTCYCALQENDRVIADRTAVESSLTSEQGEVARLQDLLDKLTSDKRKLANRVNKLISNGK